ncbi:hypothetical protein C0993_012430, partial [Termitomyces sp. T159_Od127]
IEGIATLQDGVGIPPPEDPQTFLGTITAAPLKSEERFTCDPSQDLLVNPISSLHILVLSITLSPLTMPPYRNKYHQGGCHSHQDHGSHSHGHPYDTPSTPKHSWVHQDEDDQMVYLILPDRKPGYTIHPLQMVEFLEFNKKICGGKGCTKLVTRFGFEQFAAIFNSVPT